MKKKTLIYGGIGVAVAVLGYLLYKKITKPVIYFGEIDEDDTVLEPSDDTTFPLKRGDKGEAVKKLQKFLISEGYNIGSFGENRDGVDGIFGSRTLLAVTENQQPFSAFKRMYPSAKVGQVSKEFYDLNIKDNF